jgi:hypothetical protein
MVFVFVAFAVFGKKTIGYAHPGILEPENFDCGTKLTHFLETRIEHN